MEPYYSDEQITLYLADNLEQTTWTQADVLVSDPPYGMAYLSGSRTAGTRRIVGDSDTRARDDMLALWDKSKPALVFGTWRQPAPSGERQRLVWFKDANGPGKGDMSMPWGSTHEEIYVLGQGWDREQTGMLRSPSVIT